MVVVVVRDQEQVQAGQRIQALSGSPDAAWACKRNRATAFGPNRIGKYTDAANLQQECRMADEGDRDAVVRSLTGGWISRVFDVLRPRLLLPRPLPATEFAQALTSGSMRVKNCSPSK